MIPPVVWQPDSDPENTCGKLYHVKTSKGLERRFCQRTSFHPDVCGPSRLTVPPTTFVFAA